MKSRKGKLERQWSCINTVWCSFTQELGLNWNQVSGLGERRIGGEKYRGGTGFIGCHESCDELCSAFSPLVQRRFSYNVARSLIFELVPAIGSVRAYMVCQQACCQSYMQQEKMNQRCAEGIRSSVSDRYDRYCGDDTVLRRPKRATLQIREPTTSTEGSYSSYSVYRLSGQTGSRQAFTV